jgi:hypothetical protein
MISISPLFLVEPEQTLAPFPPGFPSELASLAYVYASETLWRPKSAIAAIEWFGAHEYAVLGTEVFLRQEDRLQSVPYFQSVDRQKNEDWNSFVARGAAETIRYLTAFQRQMEAEGDVWINVSWVSALEFKNLRIT